MEVPVGAMEQVLVSAIQCLMQVLVGAMVQVFVSAIRCLVQVPVGAAQLRSRASLLLTDLRTAILYVWHGAKSPAHTVLRAKEIAAHLLERYMYFCISEITLEQ